MIDFKNIVHTLISVVRWLAGLFLLFMGLVLGMTSVLSGLAFALIALFIVPKSSHFINSKLPFEAKTWQKSLVIFGLFIFAISIFPSPPKTESVAVLTPTPTPEIISEVTPSPIPSPSPEATPEPSPVQLYKVSRVIDGDTIEIEYEGKKEKVRFIGIDTPEVVDPRKSVQCFGKEASKKTSELLSSAMVSLESDISDRDKYGRLLRYVYKDGVFINELLVLEGYAQASAYPPDVKHQNLFTQAQEKAKNDKKGLWADAACVLPSPSLQPQATSKPSPLPTSSTTTAPVKQSTQVAPIVPVAPSTGGSFSCDCSKTCASLSCSEAQFQLNSCGCSARDGDDDGIACDKQCQ